MGRRGRAKVAASGARERLLSLTSHEVVTFFATSSLFAVDAVGAVSCTIVEANDAAPAKMGDWIGPCCVVANNGVVTAEIAEVDERGWDNMLVPPEEEEGEQPDTAAATNAAETRGAGTTEGREVV